MSNKSGASSQVISLPSGGGALQGTGETFSPDLFTGTGNFTAPIALSSGRGGFHPELNLVYNTGSGNGPFGLGWGVNIPGVRRKTSKGMPRYDDAKDVFILAGAEDLVPVEVQGARTRYKPRTEGLFARIFHHHDAQSDFWKVQSKDGLVSRYVTEGVAGTDPTTIAEPAKRDKVFAWKLTETAGPFVNRVEYEYERDTGEEGPHRWDQLYLKQIRYAENEDEFEQEQFLISVTFEYGERPDSFSEYRLGFEIRTRKRCKRVIVRTHAEEEHVVPTYELVYLDEWVAEGELHETVLPRNGVSLLNRIWVVGHDESQPEEDDRSEVLPPLEFGYTRFSPREQDFFSLEGREQPARSLASPDVELVGLFGNGLPDIVEMNRRVYYRHNLESGRFDVSRLMKEVPTGVNLNDPRESWNHTRQQVRRDLGEFPNINFSDPRVRFGDMSGDGLQDVVLIHDGNDEYWPNLGHGDWGRSPYAEQFPLPL